VTVLHFTVAHKSSIHRSTLHNSRFNSSSGTTLVACSITTVLMESSLTITVLQLSLRSNCIPAPHLVLNWTATVLQLSRTATVLQLSRTATAYSYKPLELTYWRTLSIVASLLGRDVTAGMVTWLLPRHRRCLQRCLATCSRLDRFGIPRLASALLGTARRIHRFVYDCVIAERVSMLESLYGVNTPQY
jgi:hypothetical protein